MSTQLTEEQIWEEVENWVNSLVEEGYDLSEYTWEDMYENYLIELKGALAAKLGRFLSRAGGKVWQGAKPVLSNLATKAGKFGVAGLTGLAADELLTRGAGREVVAKGLEQTRKLGPALRGEKPATAKPTPTTSGEKGQIISAAGGKGGKVTVGKEYEATLGGKKGTVKYDPSGKKTFTSTLSSSYEYGDAFDLVLEYLLSQGHVDTLDEALYVMMEMDSNIIYDICEAAADQSDKQIDKSVKTTYKAGNVLDNLHQGRSRGLNRLSRTDRDAKVKRMRGRLKARREDLFGERNKREDAAREEIRKKYGF
jgi:hypothetical protein